jgi:biofilm PGA synthesis lipoprotein PgaB
MRIIDFVSFNHLLKIFTGCCLFIVLNNPAQAGAQPFLILNYHDIIGSEGAKPPFNSMDVSLDHFEGHLAWLKQQGYQVISVQQLVDAAAGKTSIPDKSVMLTFDDGYQSVYHRVLPLLKKYQYPATVALVGNWLDQREIPDEPGKTLLTWEQIREIRASGLVEIASHSYDLHHSLLANPQGDQQAATVTRLYDPVKARYESDERYQLRISQSLLKSADFILQRTGQRPRVMVWPYGEYNALSIAAAQAAGMPITMVLNDGSNTLADLPALRRLIIVDNPDVQQFAEIVTTQRANRALRVAHLDLDYLFDDDIGQTKHNLQAALQRIKAMHINTVFLQAYADPDGDGNADALYFPNRHLPVKRDLFNRVAWQLKSVARVKVYAWLPILAYQGNLPADWYVQEWRDGKAQKASHIYTRLSPFQTQARQFIAEIYEDLAKHCNFDGVLFHDDGILSEALDYQERIKNLTSCHNSTANSSGCFFQRHSDSFKWSSKFTETPLNLASLRLVKLQNDSIPLMWL